jgi:hypothetical protein
MPASVLAGFLGDEEDHSSGVPRGIPGLSNLSDFPLASDLRGDLLHIARADVGERDDCDLTRRFRAHILSDALHPLNRVGRKHVREIIHEPGGSRDLDALQ